MKVVAYLGLGSSLGDRETHLRQALARLANPNVTIMQVSSVYESPHLGLKAGDEERYPPHYNCVAKLETSLSAIELLMHIQAVEELGQRQRTETWGARTIDIDILLYGDSISQNPKLTLPHPGLTKRAFVVCPLAEIAPDLTLPDETRIADRVMSSAIGSQTISRCNEIDLNG